MSSSRSFFYMEISMVYWTYVGLICTCYIYINERQFIVIFRSQNGSSRKWSKHLSTSLQYIRPDPFKPTPKTLRDLMLSTNDYLGSKRYFKRNGQEKSQSTKSKRDASIRITLRNFFYFSFVLYFRTRCITKPFFFFFRSNRELR